MFDPETNENNEEEFQDEEEHNEEEKIWNDRELTDFDYLKVLCRANMEIISFEIAEELMMKGAMILT